MEAVETVYTLADGEIYAFETNLRINKTPKHEAGVEERRHSHRHWRCEPHSGKGKQQQADQGSRPRLAYQHTPADIHEEGRSGQGRPASAMNEHSFRCGRVT